MKIGYLVGIYGIQCWLLRNFSVSTFIITTTWWFTEFSRFYFHRNNNLVVHYMKEVGVILHYPKLLDNNYGVWATKMKIFMRAQGVWVAVVNKVGVD